MLKRMLVKSLERSKFLIAIIAVFAVCYLFWISEGSSYKQNTKPDIDVCKLNRIDAAFQLADKSIVIFSDKHFWLFEFGLGIEDKKPRLTSDWFVEEGDSLHLKNASIQRAFTYNGDRYLVVNDMLFEVVLKGLYKKKFVLTFKKSLEHQEIPFIKCINKQLFNQQTGHQTEETCFFVPLKSIEKDYRQITLVNDPFYGFELSGFGSFPLTKPIHIIQIENFDLFKFYKRLLPFHFDSFVELSDGKTLFFMSHDFTCEVLLVDSLTYQTVCFELNKFLCSI